ncbi:hypothetical protein M0802_003549 [Mischocyttarus mexicanus]|nr:hypothetical protein M0802_003549 [Mischocyttarus mexicanus]
MNDDDWRVEFKFPPEDKGIKISGVIDTRCKKFEDFCLKQELLMGISEKRWEQPSLIQENMNIENSYNISHLQREIKKRCKCNEKIRVEWTRNPTGFSGKPCENKDCLLEYRYKQYYLEKGRFTRISNVDRSRRLLKSVKKSEEDSDLHFEIQQNEIVNNINENNVYYFDALNGSHVEVEIKVETEENTSDENKTIKK